MDKSYEIMVIKDFMRRESGFTNRLAKSAPELLEEYEQLKIARMYLDSVRADNNRSSRSSRVSSAGRGIEPPEGFVLSDEVRAAVRTIKKNRFRAAEVIEILTEKYPDYMTPDKKGSVGATLSNLVTKGELDRNTDIQRKVWYTVIGLREPQGGSQPELLPE